MTPQTSATRLSAPPALDNMANNFSFVPSEDSRARRYRRRALLWEESQNSRLKACGRRLFGSHVAVRLKDGRAGYAGLQSCGSVWMCPVCAGKISARRAVEIGSAVAVHQSRGGSVGLLTLTVRHHAGLRLALLWLAVMKAWGKALGGSEWKKAQTRFGVTGWIRVVEVTHGQNGWHPHLHVLVFFDPDGFDASGFCSWLFPRWFRMTRAVGLDALSTGQDFQLIESPADAVALYLTKADDRPSSERVALELTHNQSKQARTLIGTVTPWAFLDLIELSGDADALDLWREWEKASKGRRQISWSAGLRELLAVPELDDQEIADEEVGSREDTIALLSKDAWKSLVERPHLIPKLLTAVESDGIAGLRSTLDSAGVPYDLV